VSGRRSYVGELEWSIAEIRRAFSDRNPNREAAVQRALAYATEVSIARAGREPLPERPDIRGAV
jgi:hypothetical protein